MSISTSLFNGISGGKAAKKAAQTQSEAYQKGIDEQHRQFDTTQANFKPYQDAGGKGLSGLLDLLGLNGNQTQGLAIDGLKSSPAFTSLYNTGSDTILQNAAATGGLRGGNTQNSLANFGSNLLSTVIQQQLGSLGGLVNTGVGAVNSVGGFGQQTANNVAGLLGAQGNAQATGILSRQQIQTNTINDIESQLMRAFSGGMGGGAGGGAGAGMGW